MEKISVIIPTYNETLVIGECLKSLEGQSIKGFEVIVVDDGSTDSTVEHISGLVVNNFELKLVFAKHLGAGAARNLGAERAMGEILVFVDADMTFDPDFLKKLTNPISSGSTKGTFVKDERVSNWDNVLAKCWNLNEGWQDKKRHPKNYPDHQPVFRAIVKSEFDRVGGFTPGGYDDDWSLSKKLGYEAVSAPGAIFYHKNPETLSEIYKHAKWVAKRKYKYGYFGYLVAAVRASLPISLIVGAYKSVRYSLPAFLIFKVVYDFGIFVGIFDFIINKKNAK